MTPSLYCVFPRCAYVFECQPASVAPLANLGPDGLSPIFGNNKKERPGTARWVKVRDGLFFFETSLELRFNNQNVSPLITAYHVRLSRALAGFLSLEDQFVRKLCSCLSAESRNPRAELDFLSIELRASVARFSPFTPKHETNSARSDIARSLQRPPYPRKSMRRRLSVRYGPSIDLQNANPGVQVQEPTGRILPCFRTRPGRRKKPRLCATPRA